MSEADDMSEPDDIIAEELPVSLDEAELDELLEELELELELEPAVLLLLPQAVMTSAKAPIPAMVAIALLAEVRDTRPTSVSAWEAL